MFFLVYYIRRLLKLLRTWEEQFGLEKRLGKLLTITVSVSYCIERFIIEKSVRWLVGVYRLSTQHPFSSAPCASSFVAMYLPVS